MTRFAPVETVDASHAAMEPAEDRPDDAGVKPVTIRLWRAAMEPAEDRPDDHLNWWSRKPRLHAAMEPAEDRPDDLADAGLISSRQHRRNGAGRGSAG